MCVWVLGLLTVLLVALPKGRRRRRRRGGRTLALFVHIEITRIRLLLTLVVEFVIAKRRGAQAGVIVIALAV